MVAVLIFPEKMNNEFNRGNKYQMQKEEQESMREKYDSNNRGFGQISAPITIGTFDAGPSQSSDFQAQSHGGSRSSQPKKRSKRGRPAQQEAEIDFGQGNSTGLRFNSGFEQFAIGGFGK
jgi:hypothetical protein